MRLIDCDDLDSKIQALAEKYASMGREEVAEDYKFIQTVLLTAPTIYPDSLVKRGRWEIASDGDGNVCSCCECDYCILIYETEKFNFCPNCGAKMDESGALMED